MNELLRSLLDLQTLRWGEEEVSFGFERPLPAWGWALVIGGALAASLWSYSRLEGTRFMRGSLALLRAATLALLVALIAGPQLVKRTESVERDWVLVLVDRSASLTIGDAPSVEAGAGPKARSTREEQLRRSVRKSWPMWSELAKDREVVWLGFDAGAYDLASLRDPSAPAGSASASIDLGEPRGRTTMLGVALEQALARAAARPLSAIVVLSDGRTPNAPSRSLIRRLQADRVPIHTVALGSETPVGDLAVRRIDGPRSAFLSDFTPVRVDLERLGGGELGGGRGAAEGATVRLLDKATGMVLDERRVEWTGDETARTVILTTKPSEAGVRAWSVELVPDGPDLIAGNNGGEFTIELVDRPLRVLYVDGYPRWEQRYLKNLLIREPSVTCSTLILASDRRYIQEGDIEIDALPDSPEAWSEYDAVILGDVGPGVFTEDQLALLREHVARRGGGLLWIAGPGSTPTGWWESALADVLPFRRGATDGQGLGTPAILRPTEAASNLGVMRLGATAEEPWPAQLLDSSTGWSRLQWVQRIDAGQLKPTAEVLAVAQTTDGTSESTPAVISMRFGAGRVLYVATDEIWRWRYARGEVLPERFWLQLIRLLGRESLARSGRSASIEVSPRRADVDQPVRVAVELLDQSLVDLKIPSIAVRLSRRAQAGDAGPVDGPGGGGQSAELILKPEGAETRVYSAVWLPFEPGEWTAEAVDPSLVAMALRAEVSVALPDDELHRPEADHEALARLSEETGGVVFSPDELGSLPERIPNRRVRLLNETAEALWDTPLALLSVVMLLTMEWVGRRVIRLI